MKKYIISILTLFVLVHATTNSALLTNNLTNYYFHGESLKLILTKQSGENGLSIVISPKVIPLLNKKIISGRITVLNFRELLNKFSQHYGFLWFKFAGSLYISDKSSIVRSVLVNVDDMHSLRLHLRDIRLLNNKFGYLEIPSENRVVITGPATYVKLMVQQIKRLKITPYTKQVAIYHLKYASAVDVRVSFNHQTTIIPGVATILKILMGQPVDANRNSKVMSAVVEPIKNKLANSLKKAQENRSGDSVDITSPLIEADRRLNTVIIRDKVENLGLYKNLIDLLDIPAPLIQVEVLVIHLDQQNLKSAGIDWWASAPQGSKLSGLSIGKGASSLTSAGNNNLMVNYGNVVPGQILIDNLTNFVSSLKFLESKNLAHTIAKPSIATIDNIPGVISVNERRFSTLGGSGNSSSNGGSSNGLVIVRALEITPHVIVTKNGSLDVKLAIMLQDGNIDNPGEGSTTTTTNTTQSLISSQAIIHEGQSLLLAGYTRDFDQTVVSKVPFLGSIPLLGWLFKSKKIEHRKLITLYLVTPRILWQTSSRQMTDYVVIDGHKILINHKISFKDMQDKKQTQQKKTNKNAVKKAIVIPSVDKKSNSNVTSPLFNMSSNNDSKQQINDFELYHLLISSFTRKKDAIALCKRVSIYEGTRVIKSKVGYSCLLGPVHGKSVANSLSNRIKSEFNVLPRILIGDLPKGKGG